MDWKEILSAKISTGNLPQPEAAAEPEQATPSRKEVLHILMERKGRGGKTATIIEGFECDDDELKSVAAKLKARLGTGGSARGGEILIQGDRRAEVKRLLEEMGYKTKGA